MTVKRFALYDPTNRVYIQTVYFVPLPQNGNPNSMITTLVRDSRNALWMPKKVADAIAKLSPKFEVVSVEYTERDE